MAAMSATVVNVKLERKESQFLEFRKQLKEHFREELRKESGSLCRSTREKKKLPCDNFGSFFGQSQPSIAQRLLQSKGTLEIQQSAALRLTNSTAASKAKPVVLIRRPNPHELKVSRDYSSILSDGTEYITSVSGVQSAFSSSKTVLSKPEVCNAELMPKLVKSTTKYHTSDGQKASYSGSLIARKRKSEEKIDWVELKKAKRMQNKLQSSLKVQAPDMHKASISRTLSVTKRQPEPGKELHAPNKANAMPSKRQSSSQHKTLSKQQIKPPTQEPCYGDEVDMSYISSLCQNLFRRSHAKQVLDDHDPNGDCRVASFSDILREERKSAKLARKEDQIEQLREEREEKLRREGKKEKLNQN
ncbi:hypothetical protein KPL71_022554 [Citrus sinensis]|uniref:Uncharacterized protein n=1 Tax=Citrus sinensis TaxID=2711 RepID=A0ACB8ICV0_CITSI|nr:hypothetical protein KPL71_022554 [Citrus sinensis]